MKSKSVIVLLLAGVWGIGSWWWYTCKIKGFCGAETSTAQVAAGTAAAGLAGLAGSAGDAVKATADAATGAAGDAAKATADAATGAVDATAQAAADAAKATAGAADAAVKTLDTSAQSAIDQANADMKAMADADKAAADQAKADADKAAADQAKADADKAAADQAKADSDKVTMETTAGADGSDIGPATLHFPTGSANPQLADETKAYFEKVAKFLKDNGTSKVTIVGHTDNKGDAAKNKALGLKRAEMLQQMLVKLGAPKDRVSAASEGADKPIADNGSEEGRKKNRRVEITPVK
jgi:outer membrane protein OmpA-like peptidoglycan-associated protein